MEMKHWLLMMNGNFEKQKVSNGESKVWCKTDGKKEDRGPNIMEMLGLKESVVQMVKANGVRWYWHVLRRDDEHVLRKALEFVK